MLTHLCLQNQLYCVDNKVFLFRYYWTNLSLWRECTECGRFLSVKLMQLSCFCRPNLHTIALSIFIHCSTVICGHTCVYRTSQHQRFYVDHNKVFPFRHYQTDLSLWRVCTDCRRFASVIWDPVITVTSHWQMCYSYEPKSILWWLWQMNQERGETGW